MSSTVPPAPSPETGGKRQRTRAALVSATLEIVAEKGFAGASLDEIAARAGMTKGAIYSNFASKAELLLAAVGAKGLTLSSGRPQSASLAEELAATTSDLVATLRRASGEAAFLADFQLHALSDPELRKGVAASYAAGFSMTADYLAKLAGAPARMPARDLAVALQALAMGFLVQSFITPDDVTEAVVRKTMDAFAAGVLSKVAQP